MPEEKKEKFTFSDKIKSSKPAGNKSFAKSSAKIGRDGKPKATLFERTRRDAPFFIAALVALLLLPFLYKYSGQASDEQLLTPGNEQADFDPERYGFDTAMIEDPDGQIAQLAGRDSLSLIKGWGSNQEEDYGRDDMDLDASSSYDGSAEGEYAAERHSSSEMDVEDNITNIYKRRAGKATRAAFRRTKIGTLNTAGLRRPGGSRLGINNWGGGLKGAAKRVGPSAPASAPKPVSLQPLRAAGSRSTFGQGGAAAARKSKDNMGKANAIEALRDSYVQPVGPTRTGGLDLSADGRMGGSGKLNRNINITPGKEPWWWDMMKTRMQKEWEARFKRKWDWINWMDNLARNILGGILNCLITGDDDGDMGSMFGYGDGGGKSAKCGSLTASDWAKCAECQKYGSFGSHACKAYLGHMSPDSSEYKKGWQEGSGSGKATGFIGARLNCLGIRGSGYLSGELGLNGASMQCTDMPNYTVIPSGEARKWNIYTYVVARNYFPDSLKKKLKLTSLQTKNGEQNLLCASMDRKHGGTSLNHGNITGGVGYVKAQKEKARQAVIEQTKATSRVPSEQQKIRERALEVDQESLGDGCVIVVSRGNVLPYEAMKNKIMDLFKELGNGKVSDAEAEKAFYELDLMYVSSFAAKDKLAYAQWFESGHNLKGLLPMPYWEFNNAYIQHKKVTHKKDGSNDNVYKKKWRVKDKDMVYGPMCYYDNLNFECGPEDSATAMLKFNATNFKGGSHIERIEPDIPSDSNAYAQFGESYQEVVKEAKAKVYDKWVGAKPSTDDVTVSAEFRYLNYGKEGSKTPVTQPMIKPVISDNGFTFTYTFDRIYDSDKVTRTTEAISKEGLVGNVVWTAKRGEQVVTRTCPLNMSGDGDTIIVEPKPCPQGPQTSKECCEEIYGSQDKTNTYKWEGGKCVITPPDTGGDKKHTIYAPQISCVPLKATDRNAVVGKISCSLFTGKSLVSQYQTSGQSCKDLFGFSMDSKQATAFANRVKEAYNKAHPGLPIVFEKEYPLDSEFIDALNIASSVGIHEVPVAAVCELGRDFVRMSKDKHAGNRSIQAGKTGTKQEDLIFRNELGAFLAYIHDTSILYPDAFVRYGGKSTCDWRFQPYHVADGGCNNDLGPKMGKAYAHNNYNGTNKGDKYQRFMSSLTPIMKQVPLKALANGKDLPHHCGNCKSMNGKNYVKQYNSYNGFAGLLHEQDESVNGQGVACEAFLGGNKNATMSVADALKYIEGLCTAGLDYKPYGVGAEAFNQNQRPTTSGGQSGKDEITSRPIN